MSLRSFKVLTFDCYGTLIDWERVRLEQFVLKGLIDALGQAGYDVQDNEGELLSIFSSIESPIQTEYPNLLYPQVLERVLEEMTVKKPPQNQSVTQQSIQKFGKSISEWPAFSDSPAALAYLQQHYKLVILSNVDRESFAASEQKLGVKFDLIITAQDVGSYKPALNHFKRALEQIKSLWGYEPDQVLHTFQSLFHDAVPANQMGLATCHINRSPLAANGGATPAIPEPPKLNYEFATLQALADAVKLDQ